MILGQFRIIEYAGNDAADVLVTIMSDENTEIQVHEVVSETERRIGFMPNDPEPEESEEDDE
jgi:hypothetical protein